MTHDIYVSPEGTPEGAGTRCNPLDLGSVVGKYHYLVFPGVKIHLMPGVYEGDYFFIHAGQLGAITLIDFELGARIKGNLTINPECSYITVRNLHAFDEPETRFTPIPPNGPPGFAKRNGLTLFGKNTLAIHPFVRDVVASGIGFWQGSDDSVLYGAWVVNHGWRSIDRPPTGGHGHAVYQQGANKLTQNCMFAQGYSGGLRSYTTTQSLNNITIDRCITINDVLLHGGNAPSAGIEITNNVTWNQYLEIGETSNDNDDVLLDGNYTVGYPGNHAMVLRYWKNPVITNNVFITRKDPTIGMAAIFQIRLHSNPESFICDYNTYYVEDANYTQTRFVIIAPNGEQTAYTQTQWQALGYDTHSNFFAGLPTNNHAVVNHSLHDPERAHVAICNWQGLDRVMIDLSGGRFTPGRTYQAYHAMNPDEWLEFVYDGSPVAVNMHGWSRAVPVGDTAALTEDTWPDFLALVIKAVI